jgi:cell division protein FtsB
MDSDRWRRRRAWARVVAVAVLTVAAVYVVRVLDLAVAVQRAERVESELATEVTVMAAEVAVLQTAAAEAQSDAAVERWAREQRGLARDGDKSLVVVAPSPPPGSGPRSDASATDPWSRFRAWLAQRRR